MKAQPTNSLLPLKIHFQKRAESQKNESLSTECKLSIMPLWYCTAPLFGFFPLALGASVSHKCWLLDYWLTLHWAPKNTFREGAHTLYMYLAYLGNLGRYIAHPHCFSHVSCPLVNLTSFNCGDA